MRRSGLQIVCILGLLVLALLPARTSSVTLAASPCTVTYAIPNQWGDGFLGEVVLTNTSPAALSGWTVGWSFSGNQQITNLWNGVVTQTGQTVRVANAAWNGSIPVNGSVSFGFQGTFSGTNAAPTSFSVNGQPCGEGAPTPTNTPQPSNTPLPTSTLQPTSTPTSGPTSTRTPTSSPTSTPPPSGCGTGILVCDDFESQTGSEPGGFWSAIYPECSGSGMVMVDTSQAHSGRTSLMVHGYGNYCDHAFFGNTSAIATLGDQLYGRFFIRKDSDLPTGHITLLALTDANDGNQDVRLGAQRGVLDWNRESDDATMPLMSDAGVALSVALPARTWSCVEFSINSASGTLQAWMNGVDIPGMHGDGVPTAEIDSTWYARANWRPRLVDFRLGWESYSGGTLTNLWYDDVALGTQRIGCGTTPPPTPTPIGPTATATPITPQPTATPTPIGPTATPNPNGITANTTIAELCPNYRALYIDRDFLDYLPGDGSGGHGGLPSDPSGLNDSEKAALYGVNIAAIQANIGNGSLRLGDLGTQALGHVQRLVGENFPKDAICKLLPRLMLLGPTETPTFHKTSANPWAETAGPVAASAPGSFMQTQWPTDARTYVPAEKAERDRCHDQPQHEGNVGWTSLSVLPAAKLNDPTNPVLQAVRTHSDPLTGQPYGPGFSSNAPMEASARMHKENEGFWYQVLLFKNTSAVPYYLNCAVIWWAGPSSMSYDLRNGHYNNEQRPGRGYGHPQRDIIEVVYDQEQQLSVYVIRLSFHDEPYNMRTAYPNQYWSLEVGVPAQINGQSRFTTPAERQMVVDTMLNTLHVELETGLDRNIDLLDALRLRNRVSN